MLRERLYRHVERTSDEVVLFDRVLAVRDDGEAKITQFECPVLQQNIGGFYVTMDDVKASEVLTSHADFIGGLSPVKIDCVLD